MGSYARSGLPAWAQFYLRSLNSLGRVSRFVGCADVICGTQIGWPRLLATLRG